MFIPCPTSNPDSRVVCLSFLWWKVLLREGKKIFYKDPGFSQSLRFWFIKRVFCRTLLVGLWWQHTLASCSISGMEALMLPFTGYIFFLYLRTGKYRKVFKVPAEFLVRSKNQFFNLFMYPCFCQGLKYGSQLIVSFLYKCSPLLSLLLCLKNNRWSKNIQFTKNLWCFVPGTV